MAINSLSSTIVLELLRNDNYENWRAWMKNYLLAQDLWDIVQATSEPPKPENDVVGFKAWTKNNAAALHAILISCEVDILPEIREINSAKDVWNKLASMYGPDNSSNVPGSLEGEGRINNDLLEHYEPLRTAIKNGNWDAANRFLSNNEDACTFLTQFILLNDFDVALDLLKRYPSSAIVPNKYDCSPLAALASKSSAFPSGTQLNRLEKWIYDRIPIQSTDSTNEIQIDIQSPGGHQSHQVGINIEFGLQQLLRWTSSEVLQTWGLQQLLRWTPSEVLQHWGIKKNLPQISLLHHQAGELLHLMCSKVEQMNGDSVSGAVFQAIKGGIIEFIDEILEKDHQLLNITDSMGRNILFYAVLYRQDEIFCHILGKLEELDAKSSIINAWDKSSNTILHMAAMLESSHCTRSDSSMSEVLKIWSELKWFKVVEEICLPWIKEIRNDRKMTARELFTHSHKDMMKEGKTLMKKTATSCMVIGALIITIMFTAAITVPGGNNQNTGLPMLSHKKSFMVFIIADALSLFLSTTSVLIFLGILSSGNGVEDFLEGVLSEKLIFGCGILYYSVITMIIAFCATLFIILPQKPWMVIPLVCLTFFPVFQYKFILLKLIGAPRSLEALVKKY